MLVIIEIKSRGSRYQWGIKYLADGKAFKEACEKHDVDTESVLWNVVSQPISEDESEFTIHMEKEIAIKERNKFFSILNEFAKREEYYQKNIYFYL